MNEQYKLKITIKCIAVEPSGIAECMKEVFNGDYQPGDLHSVCDCLNIAIDKANRIKEDIEQTNRFNAEYGFFNGGRVEISGIRFSFYRADSTVINEIDINSVEEIAFTNEIVTNFCML